MKQKISQTFISFKRPSTHNHLMTNRGGIGSSQPTNFIRGDEAQAARFSGAKFHFVFRLLLLLSARESKILAHGDGDNGRILLKNSSLIAA